MFCRKTGLAQQYWVCGSRQKHCYARDSSCIFGLLDVVVPARGNLYCAVPVSFRHRDEGGPGRDLWTRTAKNHPLGQNVKPTRLPTRRRKLPQRTMPRPNPRRLPRATRRRVQVSLLPSRGASATCRGWRCQRSLPKRDLIKANRVMVQRPRAARRRSRRPQSPHQRRRPKRLHQETSRATSQERAPSHQAAQGPTQEIQIRERGIRASLIQAKLKRPRPERAPRQRCPAYLQRRWNLSNQRTRPSPPAGRHPRAAQRRLLRRLPVPRGPRTAIA